MSLSKLSLSKSKAARPNQLQIKRPASSLKSSGTESTPTCANLADVDKNASVSQLKLNSLPLCGQQDKTTESSNILYRLLDDDSDWESDTDPTESPIVQSCSQRQAHQPCTDNKDTVRLGLCQSRVAWAAQSSICVSGTTEGDVPVVLDSEDEKTTRGLRPATSVRRHGNHNGQIARLPARRGTHGQQPQHKRDTSTREDDGPKDSSVSAEIRPPLEATVAEHDATVGVKQEQLKVLTAPQTGAVQAQNSSAESKSCSQVPEQKEPITQGGIERDTALLLGCRPVLEWLQKLQLEQYFGIFVQEEIDCSILHTLSAADLDGIGISNKRHQGLILDAARKQRHPSQQSALAQHSCMPAAPRQPTSGPPAEGPPLGQIEPGEPSESSGGPGVSRLCSRQDQLQQRQALHTAGPPAAHHSGRNAAEANFCSTLHLSGQAQHQLRAGARGSQQADHAAQQVAPHAAPSVSRGIRSGRGVHQSLLQVWQANAAPALLTKCRRDAPMKGAAAAVWGSHPWMSMGQTNGTLRADLQQVGKEPSQTLCRDSPSGGEAMGGAGGVRPKERTLFASLYPVQGGGVDVAQCVHAPPVRLRPSTACRAARVPAEASLWRAAGDCQRVLPGVEDRLNKRRAEHGVEGTASEKLARGGTAYPQVDESRALKLMKLDALRQELAMHEQTVADLGHIINGMERDLGLC